MFQEEDVGLAIRELLEVGLVQKTGDDNFEMHETVRAGLEGVVAIGTRREAHGALARHYASMNMVSTEIFHLEQAGDGRRARSLARATFLEGKHWSQLHRYVSTRRLLTARDAIDIAVSLETAEGLYVLPDVVSVLGGPADAEVVLEVIRTQMSRFGSDFNWAMAMAGTYLSLAPEGEIELYRVAVHASCNDGERKNAISAILIASRGGGTVDAQRLIGLFDTLPREDQLLFAPVLLHQGNRACLRRAFEVLTHRSRKRAGQESDSGEWSSLRLNGVDDVVEFLASLPEVEDAEMLVRRSAQMGRLGGYIWKHREFLEGHCVTLLKTYDAEPEIQRGAIRVLAFTGHPNLCTLCEDVGSRTGNPIHGFATLAPLLNPGLIDIERYERRLIDPSTPPPVKVACLKILAAGGADLDTWYERLEGIDGGVYSTGDWAPLWLVLACEYPFRKAITILKEQLSSSDETMRLPAVAAVKSLGMLPFPEATEILKRAITHRSPRVRAAGALGLQERRVENALGGLSKQLYLEPEEGVRLLIAAAIAASRPSGVGDLNVPYERSEGLMLWQCIVAARTGDESVATDLVKIATDGALNWQVRRAAISAAGYLPFEAALKHMLPSIRGGTTLEEDNHSSLFAHAFLSWLLEEEGEYLVRKFAEGRETFVRNVAVVFDDGAEDLLDKNDLPSGVSVGEWAYSRLSAAGWPNDPMARVVVVNELKRPLLFSAGLRSLRRLGRRDLIECEIGYSRKVWSVIKCVLEMSRGGDLNGEERKRLREMIDRTDVGGNRLVRRIVDEIGGDRVGPREHYAPPKEREGLRAKRLSYQEAVRMLRCGSFEELCEESPVLLTSVTSEQFHHLVELGDPARDPERGVERYLHGIAFGGEGHTVSTRQVSYQGGAEAAGALIRPAIVAGNVGGIGISWHDEEMRRSFSDRYAERVLKCVAVSGNRDVLYDLLGRDGGRLLLVLGSHPVCAYMMPLLDGRIVPILNAHVLSGTDQMLECLARIAAGVVGPEIDGVLTSLLDRWTGQFEVRGWDSVGDVSHYSWRAFGEICKHPRFVRIKDWYVRLARVLYSPKLRGFNRKDVLRVLKRDPRSYIHLERSRSRAEDWEHLYEEELDLLDEACDRLFAEVE